MKKLFLISCIAIAGAVNAQVQTNSLSPTGSVGIGTGSPQYPLDIQVDTRINTNINGLPYFEMSPLAYPTFTRYKIYGDGKTFIGNFTSPASDYNSDGSMLTIGQPLTGDMAFNITNTTNMSSTVDYFTVWGNGRTKIGEGIGSGPATMGLHYGTKGVLIKFSDSEGCNRALLELEDPSSANKMIIQSLADRCYVGSWQNKPLLLNSGGGIVVLGDETVNTPPGYRLFVQTGILTEKVKVALVNSGAWADYVFDKNYKLKSLEEVKKYIDTNKHLPGVLSAEELKADGGIDLGSMDAKLMEKIEELTLYVIQLNEKNKELTERIKKLESEK